MTRTSKATCPNPSRPSSGSRGRAAAGISGRGVLDRGARAILSAAALAIALVTVAGAAGRLHWMLDLVSHFALQVAVAQSLILVGLAAQRRRRAFLLLTPLLALNAAAILPYAPRFGVAHAADVAGRNGLATVVAVNPAAHNFLFGGLRDALLRERPDIVVVSEYTPRWARRFRELAGQFPFRLEHPEDGAGGIALLSRHPLRAQRLVDLGGRIAVHAVATVGGRELRVIGVHLSTPVSATGSRLRELQLGRLRELVQDDTSPTVVLGDFNLSVYSPVYRAWLRDTGLTDSLRGRGPDISWPTWMPLLGIPIDHCLVSDDVDVLEHRRLINFGSDHYPILAEIRW